MPTNVPTAKPLGRQRPDAPAHILLGTLALLLCCCCIGASAFAATSPAPGIPIRLTPGFTLDTVYTVPRDQGSWVNLAPLPNGHLITSDQFGKLYRIQLPSTPNTPPQIHPLKTDLGAAQGLLFAHNSLYVVANRSKDKGGSGLYRLRDTNHDGEFEEAKLLLRIDGDGEHGPHAIVPSPDGKSLYLLAGNATFLPSFQHSFAPTQWAMDMPLPHLGQTDGVWRTNRPGGWICRMNPDGDSRELFAVGLRNPYDMAFNADGELFTFDADMEWDLGTPWYRPTRVNHVVQGAEFGWRTGSSKWPDYYADSHGSVLDVGESSPTGLTFGYGARFPATYQRALFMGDWSYGKIFALHLQPDGSTYSATLETFLSGSPLPITDLVIHPSDGALYFVTGGRGTPSTLYRIRYTGSEPTRPAELHSTSNSQARTDRHRLEQLHHPANPAALDTLWPFLSHPDRTLRYAARVALEHQPLPRWRNRALAEPNPRAQLTALLALVRCGNTADRTPLLDALAKLDPANLDRTSQLDCLRIGSLVVCRMGPLPGPQRDSLLAPWNNRFPTSSYELNRELAQLWAATDAPNIVPRLLLAMQSAPSQEEQLHYALCLRALDPNQWQDPERQQFFSWISRATAAGGGVTYSEYLRSIRSEAIEKLTPANHAALKFALVQPPPPDPYAELKQRSLVQEWKLDDLLPSLPEATSPARDAERGRRVFSAAMCIKCHRLNRQGGLTGPDLTGVANRFDNRTILESILEPSKVVSDQYATVEITTKDGDSYTGRIGDQNDKEVLLKADLLNPANIRRITWADIESVSPSPLSLMPTSLVDYFTRDEILDLLAYLHSVAAALPGR